MGYFEQREVWHPLLDRDPYFKQKARFLLSMVPREEEVVQDMGCGNRSFQWKTHPKIVAILDDLNRFQFKSAKARNPYWIVALYARN